MNPFFNPLLRKMDVGPDAGENVSVTGNTVNFIGGGTGGAVYNAGPGLTLSGNVFSANVAAVGFGMELAGGTASYARYRNIETASGSSVTIQAGHAYKVYATSVAVTLNTETIPAGQYGQEGHLEIFVAGTGYVVTGTNVVLANALEPDSVNNCTVRFHDGIAIIAVEDHVAGYIVVNGATSGSGSLYYGIATSTNDYVAFDASLNGQAIPLAGAVAEGEKHVVGNGYTETIVSGGINCTSKTTFANLGMNGVIVSSGTLTLGDVFIPNGATVSVNGGGLAVEKVTGNGGVIDLNGNNIPAYWMTNVYSGVVISGGSDSGVGGAVYAHGATVTVVGCTITGCTGGYGGAVAGNEGSILNLSATTMSNNTATTRGKDIYLQRGAKAIVTDCEFSGAYLAATQMDLHGSNIVHNNIIGDNGSVSLTSGAILDLTGNTNTPPIAPGGGITFESGGATVLYGEVGSVSSMFIDNATANTIGNNGTIVGGASARAIYTIPSGATVAITGGTLTGGNAYSGGAIEFGQYSSATSVTLNSVMVSGNIADNGPGIMAWNGTLVINSCVFGADQTITLYGNISPVNVQISGDCALPAIIGINGLPGGTIAIADNTKIDISGVSRADAIVPRYNAPSNTIAFGSGCQIKPYGATEYILLNGGTAGTCKLIKNDGTTE